MGYNEEKQRQLDMRYLRMARIWAENSYCHRRKVGALVRYAESDLLAYLDERTRTGTSHQGLQSY